MAETLCTRFSLRSCSEIVVVTDVLEYFMEYGAWEIVYIQLYFTILHGSTK